jgi:hypothetical protein
LSLTHIKKPVSHFADQDQHSPVRKWSMALGIACALALASCGGDNEDPDGTEANISSFTASTESLTTPAAGAAAVPYSVSIPGSVKAKAGSSPILYLHIIPGDAPNTVLSLSNLLESRTCGATFSCDTRFTCTLSSSRVLSCGGRPGLTLNTGLYGVVGRLCVKNSRDDEVCDKRSVPLTIR